MEFDLIDYIKSQVSTNESVILGIDDDAAIVQCPNNHQLAVSTDTLVNGIHFNHLTTPEKLGHKALAVNLSDLAAMGAEPQWVTLNLTLPKIDMQWVESFMRGFLKLANQFGVCLIGGDTTQGPLSITVTAMGVIENNKFLSRKTANKHDLIAVTGYLGAASFTLEHPDTELADALHTPYPQIEISRQIRDFATSCIDISDGLLADLGHICKQSQCGAKISLEQIPVHSEIKKSSPDWSRHVLSGGDDYQLCFTLAAENLYKLPNDCTIIGQICCSGGIRVYSDSKEIDTTTKGFIHFS